MYGCWLWTTQKATCTAASTLTTAPLAAGGDADGEGLATEHSSKENTAEPQLSK